MKLDQYLSKLGYGTRREVAYLFDRGRVRHVDQRRLSVTDTAAHDEILVDDVPLDPAPGTLLMLHKPSGYVCSAKDVPPLVYDLFPVRFQDRTPIIAPIGRLDRETTGLLLLTDDGALNHRVSSPKTHLPKVYEVELASDLRGDEGELFASGTLQLEREPTPLAPATLQQLDARRARITVTEGRYHQVRRMFAATGNHVVSLHRTAIGALTLGDLSSGAWRVVTDIERALLTVRSAATSLPAAP